MTAPRHPIGRAAGPPGASFSAPVPTIPSSRRARSDEPTRRFLSWLVLPSLFAMLAGCRPSPPESPGSAQASASQPSPPPSSTSPAPWFAERTTSLGVGFTHRTGTNYFMPDQVGSGVAVLDADGDGRPDLYFVQNAGPRGGARNQLFRQQPDGSFRDASSGSGADLDGPGMGAVAGDVNNDGRPDLVVTEYGATRLLVNRGNGTFALAGPEAGIDNPRWAAPASFIDYDRDGWLDLVVGNYVDYDPTQVCEDVQGRRDFCAPQAFPATSTRLWHNVTREKGGQPRFEEVTARAGLSRVPGVALGLICADFDGDAWPDIFCSDDGRPNRLFLNRHDGTFAEEAMVRGLALNAMGRTAANMGVAFRDLDGDGLGEVFVTHLAEEFHALFRQDRRGWFTDAVGPSGLQQQGWRGTGFGAVLEDFDLDGDADLAFVNGLVRRAFPGQTPVLAGVDPWWARYAQRPQLFRNDGQGRFSDVSPEQPGFCGQAQVGRTLAVADLNNDGAPDLIVGNVGGPARLFHNVAPRQGSGLKLRLVDPAAGGRDAIGAEVVVRAGQRTHWAVLQPATSYLASHEPALFFGLGPGVNDVEAVDVLWPDGSRERFEGIPANRPATLARGQGRKASL